MANNQRHMVGVGREALFQVLGDGNRYADWVVGTREIRAVDPGWPAPGTCIHYTIGYGPLRKQDRTQSLAYEPGKRLELEAKAWPAGTIRIVLEISDRPDGSLVSMQEHPSAGMAKLLHNPLLDLGIKVRNVETLRRLEKVARQLPTSPAS